MIPEDGDDSGNTMQSLITQVTPAALELLNNGEKIGQKIDNFVQKNFAHSRN
jgi:hypothetical protein